MGSSRLDQRRIVMPGSALQYRIVVWVLRLGLPLLLVLGGVVYAAHRGAVRLMEPLRWYGEVVVEELSFDLGGKVHAKDITYRPFARAESATVTARGVDIATPGLSWLVSAGLAGNQPSPAEKRRAAATKARHAGLDPEPRVLPELASLHATAEALEFGDTDWLPPEMGWVGVSTGSPFGSLGCGAMQRFDAETFEAMGVPSGPLKGEFRLDASADRAKVEIRVYAEGRSSTAWSADIRLKDPGRFFDTDWQDMALAAEQWFVTDESFVVARNRYCARLVHVTRQGYVDHHANAIAQELAKHGVSVPDELMDAFKRFDARGGELSWHSRPQAPLNRAEFKALPLEQQVQKLEAQVTVNGENPLPFRLDPITSEEESRIAAAAAAEVSGNPEAAHAPAAGAGPKPASVPAPAPPASSSPGTTAATNPKAATPVPAPAPPARPPGAATPPPAAVASASTPAPTGPTATAAIPPPAPAGATPATTKPPEAVASIKPKALPSYGRVRFDDLERAVGRTVAVETRFGTRRVGKVTAYNRAAVTIEINEKGTSLPLTVPRGTVLSVELVGPESG
jgi:hypothetical protein